MANTLENESSIDIYDQSEVTRAVSRTDKDDAVEGNGQKELYEMQEFDKSKQDDVIDRKSLNSSSKAKYAFRIILTVVVAAILIAVIIHWSFISSTSPIIKDANWSDWQNWSDCSVDCGVGFRTRSRTCSKPESSQFGTYCQGTSFDIELCSKIYCDACQSHPCHYGNCRSNAYGFKCLCFPGYSGQYCQNDIDECATQPCLNGYCNDVVNGYSCSCFTGFSGIRCETVITDCVDILRYTGSRMDGIYTVRTWKSHQVIKVNCDMTTDGGGWTVFQNRFDGSVEFYRNFSEYDTGFGNLTTEFWLGLNITQEIAGQGQTDLRIDLEAADGTKAYETFVNFYLSPGPAYTLHLGPTIASLQISNHNRFGTYHNGRDFSTYDHDVDSSASNCAVEWHGAWWYNDCYEANLNGKYLTPGTDNDIGVTYESFMYYISLKTSKMMMRRK